jgi:hypothetical protein
MGSKEYDIGICCFSDEQAAVRSKSKARVKYVTDNTYFVFIRDTNIMDGGDLWIISIGVFELVGFYFEDIIENLEQRKV